MCVRVNESRKKRDTQIDHLCMGGNEAAYRLDFVSRNDDESGLGYGAAFGVEETCRLENGQIRLGRQKGTESKRAEQKFSHG